MITKIHLNLSHQQQLEGVDILQLHQHAQEQLPYPLAISLKNFHDAVIRDLIIRVVLEGSLPLFLEEGQ